MTQLTRFCLVRHGETAWNAERRLQGQTDIPLNSQGEEQAASLAAALQRRGQHFDALYSSDLSRAHHTAQPLAAALALHITLLPDLRERHFGALQGVSLHEGAEQQPQAWQAYSSRNVEHDLDGGESLLQFAQRVRHALERLAADHAGDTVLLVSHGGVLDVMYRIACGQPLHEQRRVPIPNAALNWLSFDGCQWRVDSWADESHLTDSLDEL
ncbi:histidine phosphatase family protein [Vogesella sp. LIG4]|uniref:histidine phosphatase family protein n=1 Tax=Vogesella sp. LIG4 TaxID=1192162 RepID=UPI00081FA2A6|nr:histidine phosphatase family protein [Vogesella sp. LIG4]SCK25996.1 probable phosphoglycerate mutase [Vogesella sp. LIG4]